MRPGTMLARLAALLALAGGFAAGAANAAGPAGRVPVPVLDVDRSTQCVAPADVMRREHPEMLRHQRDRTVRVGERGAKVSLASCIDCHAGPGAGRAAGDATGSPQAFCEGCHRYAAVKLDCFDCHASKPGTSRASAPGGKS